MSSKEDSNEFTAYTIDGRRAGGAGLGAANLNPIDLDVASTYQTDGNPVATGFVSFTWPVKTSPTVFAVESNSSNANDSYRRTTITATSPAHGTLDVFLHVSHSLNTCHMSVVWTPAS